MKAPARTNLLDLDRASLEQYFERAGHKPFRARQMLKWIYHQGIVDFGAMTDLSKFQRAWLNETAEVRIPEVVTRLESRDGTTKWEGRAANGNCVETVLIPDRGRNTLCVSSQVGCILDCTFCSTGKQGFNGNLSTGEIVGQVLLADAFLQVRGESVSNVVLMGMGEPLLNFAAAIPATNIMMDDLAFGISKRRVTISTAGVAPAIYEMAKVTDVSLAVSLHAPNDELRDQLVPLNKKYPLAELLDACNHYVEGLGERRNLTMEYTLIRGVNDRIAHARELANLLRDVRCKINLIPFNPFPDSGFERPDEPSIRAFQTYLLNAGYATMLRTTRGEDINAACGQLVGQVQDRTRRQERHRTRIECVEKSDVEEARVS